MIAGFFVLLFCQLAGESLTRALALPVPGPVLGLVLLFLALEAGTARGWFDRERMGATGTGAVAAALLANLGLLFVPAGAGVVQNLDLLAAHAGAFAAILIGSTVATLLVTVFTFRAVRRWTERPAPSPPP